MSQVGGIPGAGGPPRPGRNSLDAARRAAEAARELQARRRAAQIEAVRQAELEARDRALSEAIRRMDVDLRFLVDRETGDTRIIVVDGVSGKVIRVIPPESFLRAAQAMPSAVAPGALLDEGF